MNIYISTTLPYANSTPHIGHCLEFLQADTFSRFFRNKLDVVFNVGLDEHGQKVYDSAKKKGVDVSTYLDELSEKWILFCEDFHIDYDIFYRTSDDSHKSLVKKYWSELLDKGDIYKKKYTAKYCSGCESFKTEKDLHFGVCLDHPNNTIENISEENYFFKLSSYKSEILKNIEKVGFLSPKTKLNELKDIVENCEDISISRQTSSVKHGIICPNDEQQVIYVWFDALLNYIFSIGEKEWSESHTIQICGPDNIRFQGLILQGLLLANGNKSTDKLLIHGTVLNDGKKMSKSTGNVIDPVEQLNKYGLSAVRIYILTQLSQYNNSNYNEDELISFHNSFLCNEFGNLITRTLHLIDIKDVDVVEYNNTDEDTFLSKKIKDYEFYLSNLDLQASFNQIQLIIKNCNQLLNDEKPWSKESQNYESVLSYIYHSLEIVTSLIEPFLPNIVEDLKLALKYKKKVQLFNRIENEA